jgi:hypothetical protein
LGWTVRARSPLFDAEFVAAGFNASDDEVIWTEGEQLEWAVDEWARKLLVVNAASGHQSMVLVHIEARSATCNRDHCSIRHRNA